MRSYKSKVDESQFEQGKAEEIICHNNERLHKILVSRGFSDAEARAFIGFAQMIGLLEQWKDSILQSRERG